MEKNERSLVFHWDPTGREVTITYRWREVRHKTTGETCWVEALKVRGDRTIPRERIRETFRTLASDAAELGKEA